MPEGDTIHKVAAAIRPMLEGRRVLDVRSRDGAADGLAGGRVASVAARGKHLLIEFDSRQLLRSHLGMHGSWHRYAPGEPWRKPERQASLVLQTGDDVLVCFNAKEVELLRAGSVRHRNAVGRLGPDLLGPSIDLDAITRRARELVEPETILADVLLDQRVACGIGNVYKSELLFLERCHPAARSSDVARGTLRQLYERARELLLRNLGGGPRVTRFEDDGRGGRWVYGRARQPCLRCGAPISRAALGRHLRATFWCPRCQPSPVRRGNQPGSSGSIPRGSIR